MHHSCDPGCPIFFTWWVDLSHVASAKVSSVEWHRNRSHCLAWLHQGALLTARRDQKRIKLLNKLYVIEVKKPKESWRAVKSGSNRWSHTHFVDKKLYLFFGLQFLIKNLPYYVYPCGYYLKITTKEKSLNNLQALYCMVSGISATLA